MYQFLIKNLKGTITMKINILPKFFTSLFASNQIDSKREKYSATPNQIDNHKQEEQGFFVTNHPGDNLKNADKQL